ncbi:P-loop containing nucleoside triphosphate hydrolase protein [Serendipita vermifera]|nr:P-loop containing nucleoside triphosphate hydrolase protein [Serendipita vermifera]
MAGYNRQHVEDSKNWSGIMLIGDDGVGKHSLAHSYMDEKVYSGAKWIELSQQIFIRTNLPLNSSPIHRSQRKPLMTRANKHEREMIEMEFSLYQARAWEFWSPPPALGVISILVKSDVVVICYDCSRPETLHNAIYKWHPIVLHHGTNAPIVLVGCKSDLKPKDPNCTLVPFVTTEEAKKAARQIGAIDALECSESDGRESFKKIGDLLAWYAYYSHFWDAETPSTRRHLQAFRDRKGSPLGERPFTWGN